METDNRSEGGRYDFSGRFNLPPRADGSGGASAAVDASTGALAVLGVVVVAGVALVMLNQGVELGAVQNAAPELLGRVGRLVAAAA